MYDLVTYTRHQLQQGGIVARLPGSLPADEALSVADALLAAPVLGVEIAWHDDDTTGLVSDLSRRARGHMLVGVGGIETPAQLETAVSAGAHFVSSPRFAPDLLSLSQTRPVVYLPSVISILAAQMAARAGCRLLRLRTGGSGGPAYVQQLLAAVPGVHVVLAATDDESLLSQTTAYVRAGATAVFAGASLFAGAGQPMASIIANARRYRHAWAAGKAPTQP